jgi:hypothetical protein
LLARASLHWLLSVGLYGVRESTRWRAYRQRIAVVVRSYQRR